MSDRDWAMAPVLNADDIEDILGAAIPPRERARAHYSQYPKRMEGENTRSVARRRPNRTSYDERGRPQEAENVGTVSSDARRRLEQLDNSSRSHSVSYVPSDSSGSIEIIQDVNIRHEHRGPPGEAYGRGRPGSYGGDFVTNAARTQHERAQWDGRTHHPVPVSSQAAPADAGTIALTLISLTGSLVFEAAQVNVEDGGEEVLAGWGLGLARWSLRADYQESERQKLLQCQIDYRSRQP